VRKKINKKSIEFSLDYNKLNDKTGDLISPVFFESAVLLIAYPKGVKNSDIFVLPSRNETFGVVYIEALACGLPIIATDCGVPSEIVTPENGLFIPKENVDALSSAISYMAQNINQYDRKAIAEDCQARFSSEVIAKQLTHIFEETIKNYKK
jgi:glycosyltransferase involved in cell wall biosynthesis